MAGIPADPALGAAARALAAGDPLGALNRVALRDDAPALALRGIAMAQLGDLERARALLRGAARSMGSGETLGRARCVVAEAEVALASRDLGWSPATLGAAVATLERGGDRANAAHARQLEARRLLLIGRVDAAERALAVLDVTALPPALQAIHHLVRAGIAMRRLRARDARDAIARAARAAGAAGIASLAAEAAAAAHALDAPAARRVGGAGEGLIGLDEVESTLASGALVVDACRNVVVRDGEVVSLASRWPRGWAAAPATAPRPRRPPA